MKNFVEFLAWLRIVASPTVVGFVLGGISYVKLASPLNQYLALFFVFTGILLGILWAKRVRKRKTAVDFMAEVNRSRDADQSN